MTGMEMVFRQHRKESRGAEESTPGDAVKCGARVVLGVAGGYLLGRTRKMRLALMLGGMAAGRRAGGPGELLAQGSKLMSRSPELSQLIGDVRGRLLDAGKDAALAVATRRVESWADRVAERPADGASEREPGDENDSTPGRGTAVRSRSSSTTAPVRRSTSTRGSGRTARTAKSARPARAGQEGRDD